MQILDTKPGQSSHQHNALRWPQTSTVLQYAACFEIWGKMVLRRFYAPSDRWNKAKEAKLQIFWGDLGFTETKHFLSNICEA